MAANCLLGKDPEILAFLFYIVINSFFKKYLSFREREGKRGKQQFVLLLMYASLGCFLYVPYPGPNLQPWRLGMTLSPTYPAGAVL